MDANNGGFLCDNVAIISARSRTVLHHLQALIDIYNARLDAAVAVVDFQRIIARTSRYTPRNK